MNNAALRFESYGVSHTGYVRTNNEDNYLIEPESGLWAVADGVGGHEAGEVASASIVAHLATIGVTSSAPELRARFEDRLTRAHEEIRAISAARGVTIGSTIAALLAMNGSFACFWAGDSRVYLVRDGAISQISRDHTEVQELLDQGMISPSEALTWPRRHVITHAVGITDEIVIDAHQGQTLPGDIFVLSTDGLTNHVSDEEIEAAVLASPPQAACKDLLQLALDRGGTDNITIVLVHIHDAEHDGAALRGLSELEGI